MDEIDVKLIAFHLPQFHEFEENNEWWGEGFTEWTNTRNAKQIYRGHNQPREPLDERYYDLTKKEDLIWQMEIAKEYSVYGFCFYHYWFEGKKLLYKPLEMVLQMKDTSKMPYCLCWANETWTKTWRGDNTVLIEQTYGKEDEWEDHFQYLLHYFEDDCYIKHENAPVLILYRSKMIPNLHELLQYWNKRCMEYGFSGLFVIDEMNSFQNESLCQHSLQFEPLYTMKYGRTQTEFKYYKLLSRVFNYVHGSSNLIYSYSALWRNILNRKLIEGSFLGAFVDWDNTARKGKNGRIVLGTSANKFEKYLRKLKHKAVKNKSEYIFINAWNEWGEGAYLEPDKNSKYAFLEAVKNVFG